MQQQPDYGIDPEVLKLLMDRRKPGIDPLMGGMAKAASAMGTLGGVSADTSAVDQYGKAVQSRDMVDESRNQKIVQHLMNLKKQRNSQVLADTRRDESRDYAAGVERDRRKYTEGLAGTKRKLP